MTRQRTNKYVLVATLVVFVGCAAKILKKDNSDALLHNAEYEKAVKVTEAPPAPETPGKYVSITKAEYKELYGHKHVRVEHKKNVPKKAEVGVEAPRPDVQTHLPDIEDSEGFVGRRPIADPYRPGERVTFDVSYFGVKAGELSMEVLPFVYVNGRKSYHFAARGKTESVFEVFYAVDDWLETFVDFEQMIPYSYALHVKESKQLRETRVFFDWSKKVGSFWEKRITKDDGVEEKKYDWPIEDYAQNVFSAPFYFRVFTLKPGKKVVYRMAHDKDNILITGEVLRREKLDTPMGELDTVVIKPHIDINGVFKPIGDIFIWLTDDDRKFMVRIESKIRIGKIIAQAKSIEKGSP